MTPEQILNDIYTDRVKKVIVDSDTFNEMDDQYAVAYSLASDKLDVLAINAAPFDNQRSSDFADGMEKSYDEIMRVLSVCGLTGRYPVFKGSRTRIDDDPAFAPVDSPAARNIIKLAHETDEPIYVLTMGAITNVVSAFMLDPSIARNVCVVWMGGNCLDNPVLNEFNLIQDYAAGQLLLDLDIPLVLMPAVGHGTCALVATLADLQSIKGDSPAAVFFRKTLPEEHNPGLYNEGWHRIIWDIAAPGALSVPHGYEFKVIPAPVFADGGQYAFDRTRRPIVYMERVDRDAVFADAVASLSRL